MFSCQHVSTNVFPVYKPWKKVILIMVQMIDMVHSQKDLMDRNPIRCCPFTPYFPLVLLIFISDALHNRVNKTLLVNFNYSFSGWQRMFPVSVHDTRSEFEENQIYCSLPWIDDFILGEGDSHC